SDGSGTNLRFVMLRKIALWIDSRLYLSKLFDSTAGHHVPASSASWFYVFGSGTLLCFVIQAITGVCLAFVYVPSASQSYRSLPEPGIFELQANARLAAAPDSLLVVQFHGGPYVRAHGSGLSFWGLQIPARADVDFRRPASLLHAGDGLHRPGDALRSGRLLGPGHRRGRDGTVSVDRSEPGQPDARRTEHRGRNSVWLHHAPRLPHSRSAHRGRRPSPAPGADQGHQRIPEARQAGGKKCLRGGV